MATKLNNLAAWMLILRTYTALACVVVMTMSCHAQEPPLSESVTNPDAPASEQKPVPAPRLVTAVSGQWTTVSEIQTVLDDISPRPELEGKLDSFAIQLFEMPAFWDLRQIKQVERAVKKIATERRQEIIGTGMFEAKGERFPFSGFFMLTQKDGETFLSPLNIDGATFDSWRIHHIPGKTRSKDLLIIEMAEPTQQIVGLQFDREIPAPSVPTR